jgi:hypothetical protein
MNQHEAAELLQFVLRNHPDVVEIDPVNLSMILHDGDDVVSGTPAEVITFCPWVLWDALEITAQPEYEGAHADALAIIEIMKQTQTKARSYPQE